MDTAGQDWTLTSGQDVIGADGGKLGEVSDALGDYFVVQKGWFFPTEYSVPSSAITNVDDQAVSECHQGRGAAPGLGPGPGERRL